jgi:hypothetical protein
MTTDRKAFRPCVVLRGGPRHGRRLAEVDLTAANLDGYRKTADSEPYDVVGPRGGVTGYTLRVWRHTGALR